jgi:hypothetical protein
MMVSKWLLEYRERAKAFLALKNIPDGFLQKNKEILRIILRNPL